MLWALLAAYLLSGGDNITAGILSSEGINRLIDRIETVIVDVDRSTLAISRLDNMNEEIEAFSVKFDASAKEISTVYKDYEAKELELSLVLEQLNAEWEVSQRAILDQRFKLKEHLTKDEWESLFSE